ncbi:unnamed protein product [Moneuplotes crassus]|uniref:Uncharacterized protein n=1 Tax=Euplotes crassus TaxID=5936 RepID=A0AAD1XFM4_EUPCR|nr:unnamed protein product [Moneuplotes crassus]
MLYCQLVIRLKKSGNLNIFWLCVCRSSKALKPHQLLIGYLVHHLLKIWHLNHNSLKAHQHWFNFKEILIFFQRRFLLKVNY